MADSERKKGESLLASTPVVVLAAILGRTPTIDEYEAAVVGIELTRFAPPSRQLSTAPSPIICSSISAGVCYITIG